MLNDIGRFVVHVAKASYVFFFLKEEEYTFEYPLMNSYRLAVRCRQASRDRSTKSSTFSILFMEYIVPSLRIQYQQVNIFSGRFQGPKSLKFSEDRDLQEQLGIKRLLVDQSGDPLRVVSTGDCRKSFVFQNNGACHTQGRYRTDLEGSSIDRSIDFKKVISDIQ
ncbi:hypothetical protein BDF20DRAFT_835006 [Mycotypha africana]|uniref:uncharacterized protein n=1 Tax=Mycotypha africana TaxID=64632 RepID=UPI002300AA24|nr:uncharacterized protein BDF20DRAFT_835006 [Mycotypha africana]KAI8982379.1 hypothetical protein BDF20DRAFT_835006 [Mycotypha africana]